MAELFTNLHGDCHYFYSITNQTSSDLQVFLGQYGDEVDIFNLLTGSYYFNEGISAPLAQPYLLLDVAADSTYCVTQGPKFDDPTHGLLLVHWYAGGRNLGLCRVNFGVSVNGIALNPPPLAFTADAGNDGTAVYGGFYETNISSWVSEPVNGVRYIFEMQNGGHPPADLTWASDASAYYNFNILIKES